MGLMNRQRKANLQRNCQLAHSELSLSRPNVNHLNNKKALLGAAILQISFIGFILQLIIESPLF